MRSSHLVLVLLGVGIQSMGWALLPRRYKLSSALVASVLDAAWVLWYAFDDRSLSVSGVWALSPVATWLTAHLMLGPLLGVEVLARFLPWRRWIRYSGLAFILVGYAWGLGEAYGPPVVTEVSLSFPDLPSAFDGYRIVLVGDIHAGPYAGTRTVGRWARAIQNVSGDVLVGAGDFVTHSPEEAERTGEAFKTLHPADGLLGVLGNHDQYSRTDAVAKRLRRHGWIMLLDQCRVIERAGQRLVFLGARYHDVDDGSFEPDWQGKPWPDGFRIGLSHDPEQWPQLQKEGARLTLAAHTHGGQVDLSPIYNAAKERSSYIAGLYEDGRDRLFITRGLGCTTLPFRLRCRPEIVRITLHRG